jgi:hypothetical protein
VFVIWIGIALGSLAALLGFFTGYISGFGAWYSELFPTSIRSTVSGFCFNFGRVGAIAGIKLVPVLIPLIGFTATISLAPVSYVIAAVTVFTLQTSARPMAWCCRAACKCRRYPRSSLSRIASKNRCCRHRSPPFTRC